MAPRPSPLPDEPDPIRRRDWRLQAITTLAQAATLPSGVTHPVGTVIEAVGFLSIGRATHSIALPSPVALYLSAATDAELAARGQFRRALRGVEANTKEATSRLRQRESILFDGLQNRATATVFAYSALEAFANDSIPPDFSFERVSDRTGATERWDLARIERYLSLSEKLSTVLPLANNLPSPKLTRCWEGFRWLQGMRDRLIHPKRRDWRGVGPDDASKWIWGHLLKSQAQRAPWYAYAVISHFLAADPPRWLSRFGRQFKATFT